MTTLATKEFRVGLDRWVQDSTNPAGQPGNSGSIWVRGGSYPTDPVGIWEKTSTPGGHWTHQNLVNLNVYNVLDHGLVGDGVTDCRVALQALVNLVNAAGGGSIYFPPAPVSYRLTKGTGGGVAGRCSVLLQNCHNITFFGDGPRSKLAMIGSAGFGDWYMFINGDGSSNIWYFNLGCDGTGITNPDPAHQNHFIQNEGLGTDTHGGAHDVDITGNYFGQIIGDCVRNLAENGKELSDIRVLSNNFNMGGVARSCIEAQRYSRRVQFSWNWGVGGSDQLVDFEPTGGSGLGTAGPEEWLILGNHLDGHTGSITVTLSGEAAVDPTRRSLLAYNTITGDGVEGGNIFQVDITGNVVISNLVSSNGVMSFLRGMDDFCITGNVAESVGVAASSKIVIAFEENLGADPHNILVYGNVARTATTAAGGTSAMNCTGGNGFVFNDNLMVVDSTVANGSFGISFSATTGSELDQAMATGNLIQGTTQNLRSGVNFHASISNSRNCSACYNYVDRTVSAVLFDRGAAESLLDWRGASGNNVTNASTATLEASTNVGVTMEGPAGPGPQVTFNHLIAGPEGTTPAPVGSVALNDLGGNSTAMFYKETGSGVSGGSTGWLGVGGSELNFSATDTTVATAARYLTPGVVAVSTVPVQLALVRPGVLRNFRVVQVPGVGAGTSTYTLQVNGVDRIALVINFVAASGTFALSVTVAPGDLVSVKVTKSQAPGTAPTFVTATCELS